MRIKNRNKIYFEESKINLSKINGKSEINIQFNRIAFIFFIFFIISLVYSIHLLHLGSRDFEQLSNNFNSSSSKKLYRADIVDRNDNIIVKTVSSIDVGIDPKDVIDKQRLLINLKYIFPTKDYQKVEKKLDKKKFFGSKKYLKKIMKK